MHFTDDELDRHIRRRPAVHKICVGAFLQQPTPLTPEILAVPLSAVGYAGMTKLLVEYLANDLEIPVPPDGIEKMLESGKDANPGAALVWHAARDDTADVLLGSSSAAFRRAQRLLSYVSGDRTDVVASLVLHETAQSHELFSPLSRRRQRLWFSREEADAFHTSIVRLATLQEEDSRVALALQLYLDALNDKSDEFRLVKLFNVLECLASAHKKDGVGSRDAVRALLSAAPGQHWSVEFRGTKIAFDIISVAGIFRDKVMHGSRVERDTFALPDREVIDVLAFEPFKLADELQRLIDDYFQQITITKP